MIESLTVFGQPVVEVWINEDIPPQGGNWDSWDVCIQAARDCDVLIALSNGDAGWAKDDGAIGICHAELLTGLSRSPAKVRLIALGEEGKGETPQGERNRRFQEYVNKQNLFRGGRVSTEAELVKRVQEAICDAVVALAQAGVRDASKGRFHSGEALDWTRLDFAARQAAMCQVLRDAMRRRDGSTEHGKHLFVRFADTPVLCVPNAIPAALTVGAAREMVGQPFLRDHELAPILKESSGKPAGPVHVIACHKSATEAQATRLLGCPDATVVTAPFGVFVADSVLRVQFAFIVNCRDESMTRHGVQRFFEWLAQTGEEALVAKRAEARARIVTVINDEALA